MSDYVQYKNGEPVRFVGRCRRCKKFHRVEGPMEVERVHRRRGRLGPHGTDVWKGRWVLSVECECRDGTVTNGRTLVQLERVHATARTDHECGPRCVNATGPACSCSCRGKNHGGGAA